jgi:uncharacterized membrane protein
MLELFGLGSGSMPRAVNKSSSPTSSSWWVWLIVGLVWLLIWGSIAYFLAGIIAPVLDWDQKWAVAEVWVILMIPIPFVRFGFLIYVLFKASEKQKAKQALTTGAPPAPAAPVTNFS